MHLNFISICYISLLFSSFTTILLLIIILHRTLNGNTIKNRIKRSRLAHVSKSYCMHSSYLFFMSFVITEVNYILLYKILLLFVFIGIQKKNDVLQNFWTKRFFFLGHSFRFKFFLMCSQKLNPMSQALWIPEMRDSSEWSQLLYKVTY